MNYYGSHFYIGIDGGGSGCRARIADEDGRVVGSGTGGPATVRLGAERSIAAIRVACLNAVADAGMPAKALAEMHAAAGLAGLGRKNALRQLQACGHPFRSVVYLSDAKIACMGAHSNRDGGIVIIGTGSVAYASVKGQDVQIGGYGFPVSDEGSGAYLGLQAVRVSLRAHDGRLAHSPLTHDIMGEFFDDPFAVVEWMDRASATDYARFARTVMEHARSGDAHAGRIVNGAAQHVDALVGRLIDCGAPRVSLLGGLALPLQPWLAATTRERLSPVEGDALSGALYLARHAHHVHGDLEESHAY